MVDFTPTAYYLPWMFVVNNALIDFFKAFDSSFTRNDNGEYVFSEKFQKVKIKKWFFEALHQELINYLQFLDISSPLYRIYVVDTCKTNDNVFSVEKSRYNLSYFFVEDDIRLDMVKLEDIFDRCFVQYFSGKKKIGNVKFLKHKNLDAETIKQELSSMFGKNHFVELMLNSKKILEDMNNKIDKKKPSKKSSADFCLKELKQEIKE